MGSEPVFQNSFEVGIWRRINSERDDPSRKSDTYLNAANAVIKREGTVNSHVLSKLIEMLYETQCNGMQMLIDQLVSKSRPNDCLPTLTAALVYTRIERWDKAEEMIESVKHAQNIPMLCCVKAKIMIETGETALAKKELMRARCSDPTFPMFYELIQQLEPTEGWMYRQNIELLITGKDTIPFGDNTGQGSAAKLYDIYHKWYNGRRDEATELMIRSEEYGKKSPEFMLASARMSMDERDWHSAQRMYSSLLTKSSNCVYIICEAGKAFYSGGNFEKALALYRDAEALDPVSPIVMKGLIQTYSALGMKGEASQCIKEYLDTENSSLGDHVSGARTLLANSMYEDAESILDKVLLSYPTDPRAFILKSEIEYESGNINAALRTIMNGVDKNPNDADVRLQKARIFYRTGRMDKALTDLHKAEKLNPDNVGVLLLLKDVAVSENNNEEAIRLSNRILELDPGNIEAMNTLSKATLSAKRTEESYSSYKDMMVADNRAENFVNILSSMMSEGKYAEVVQMYNEKEREFGNRSIVKRLKGNAEYALGDYRAASASYAVASLLDPKDPMIWHSKGMADEALGELDLAEEAYNKAILLDMNESEFWVSRASIQEKKNDLTGAVESLNRAIELRPDGAYALVKKGMIFAELGRMEEALYFLNMAEITDAENTSILRIERDVYMAAGDTEKAEGLALRILESDPSDDEAVSAAVKILTLRGKGELAAKIIDDAISNDPNSIPLLLIKKEFHSFRGNNESVISASLRIVQMQPDNVMVRRDLADAYAAIGDVNSANRIYAELEEDDNEKDNADQRYEEEVRKQYIQKTPDAIKRYAERVLRRAYITKLNVSDPDLISALDLDEATATTVMTYLSDITEYDGIVPGTLEFERMEKLSMNAVIKGNCTGLDTDPIITLPCAYVAGGAKDADEAKLLVAYIYKVMKSRKSQKPLSPDLKKIAENTAKGTPTEDIIKNARIGVYQAKMIKDNI